jgi:predicted deacylase
MFGFINMSRQFPDGRDLNRVFPELKKGRFWHGHYHILTEIMPTMQ